MPPVITHYDVITRNLLGQELAETREKCCGTLSSVDGRAPTGLSRVLFTASTPQLAQFEASRWNGDWQECAAGYL